MSFADGQFASAIRDTLAEPAVRMVNFRAHGLTIGTMHFMTVAGSIKAGRIKCKVDATKITSGAAAVYSATDKTIYGSRADGFYVDEKSLFVHECTHAIVHLMGFSHAVTVKVVNNESAAYLAGAIYVVASKQIVSPSNAGSPFAAAYRIAKSKGFTMDSPTATNAGAPVDFSDRELQPLTRAIQGDRLYSRDWNNDETYQW